MKKRKKMQWNQTAYKLCCNSLTDVTFQISLKTQTKTTIGKNQELNKINIETKWNTIRVRLEYVIGIEIGIVILWNWIGWNGIGWNSIPNPLFGKKWELIWN